MSGGSWDYFCYKCSDVADQLKEDASPLRRAFGEHMALVSEAMHDIEWVDSSDKGHGDDRKAIQAVLGDASSTKEMDVLISDAQKLIAAMKSLGAN